MIMELVPCGNHKILGTVDHPGRSISKDWLKAVKRMDGTFCAWCNLKSLPKERRKYCSDECSDSSSAYCYPSTSVVAFRILMVRQNYKCAHCEHDYTPAFVSNYKQMLRWKRKEIRRLINEIKVYHPEKIRARKELDDSGKPNTAETGYNEKGHFYMKYPMPEIKEIEADLQRTRDTLTHFFSLYSQYKKAGPVWDFRCPDRIRSYHRNLKDHKEPEIDHIIPVALEGMAIGLDNTQIICYGCHKTKTKQDMIEIRKARKA